MTLFCMVHNGQTEVEQDIRRIVCAKTAPEVVQAFARFQEALTFYRTVPVLPYDEAAATHFARLRHVPASSTEHAGSPHCSDCSESWRDVSDSQSARFSWHRRVTARRLVSANALRRQTTSCGNSRQKMPDTFSNSMLEKSPSDPDFTV